MLKRLGIKNRLPKQKQTELFIKLAKALSSVHNAEEGAHLLKDLLYETEVLMLSKRLQIAELLIQGQTYEQIKTELKAGFNTIAKVQAWLEIYGEGYRTVISRISEKPKQTKERPFNKLKRSYPMYYWPQLLLEEIIKNANKKEKERLSKIVEQLKDKTKLSKNLLTILK